MKGINTLSHSSLTFVVAGALTLTVGFLLVGSFVSRAEAQVSINDLNIYEPLKAHKGGVSPNNFNRRVCNYAVGPLARYNPPHSAPPGGSTYPATQRFTSTTIVWVSRLNQPNTGPVLPDLSPGQDNVALQLNSTGHYCSGNMRTGGASPTDPEAYQSNNSDGTSMYPFPNVNLQEQLRKRTNVNAGNPDNFIFNVPMALRPSDCNSNIPEGSLTGDFSQIAGQKLGLDWTPSWNNKKFYIKPGGGNGSPQKFDFNVSGFGSLPAGCYSVRIIVPTKGSTLTAEDDPKWVCSADGQLSNENGTNCVSSNYVFTIFATVPNARLTIQTSGLPGGVSAEFSSIKTIDDANPNPHGTPAFNAPHTVGDCGITFVVNGTKNCTSGGGHGIGYHNHGGSNKGVVIRALDETITNGGNTYRFTGWTGDNWPDEPGGNAHCIGISPREKCVNMQPTWPTNTIGIITANYELAENWDYRHVLFNTPSQASAPRTALQSTWPRHRPGATINVQNGVKNEGTGSGYKYDRRIEWNVVPSSTWQIVREWLDEPGLSSGSGLTRAVNHSLPVGGGVSNDAGICYRVRINNFTGESGPSPIITSNGLRYAGNVGTASGDQRCVRVYNAPPTISDVSATCSTFSYKVNDLDGDNHDATLQARGVDGSWENLATKTDRPSNDAIEKFDINSYKDFESRTLRVVVKDKGPLGETVTSETRTVSPCLAIACGVTQYGDPEPSENFTVTFNFKVKEAGPGGNATAADGTVGFNGRSKTFNVSMESSGVNNGNGPMFMPPPNGTKIKEIINGTQNLDGASAYRDGLSVNAAGEYTITIRVNDLNPNPLTCNEVIEVFDKPYVAAFGADVIAGGGFEGMCGGEGISGEGIISAFFDQSFGRGSGAQFAALAIGDIDRFASAKMRSTSSPPSPNKGLTFANTSSEPSSPATTTFGGGYPRSHCIHDYYGQRPDGISSIANFNQEMADNSPSGPYKINSSNLAVQATNVPRGKSFALYKDGNLSIRNNVTFAESESWASVSEIQSLYVIVKGNIYINNDVTQLDGVYIAQPNDDGSDGKIFTCASSGGTPRPLNQIYNLCTNPLQVNGSLIANTIIFNRYAGSSLRYGNQNEHPLAADKICEESYVRPVCAAETINYSPEIYLSRPELPFSIAPGQGRYDAITNLTPIF
ncbi:hypothetical protein BH23PAT2_BH23PAT2_03090 [soil metagenome]